MQQTYLLLEGINIYANVLDTNQLSVVRGGSFMFKDAIKCVSLTFAPELTAISIGASSGLFLVEEAVTNINNLQKQVTARLRDHSDFRLLTFIIETCKAKSLVEAKERLLAQLRFRQLRSITIVPEAVNGNSRKPSEWGGIRPTSETPDHVTYYGTDPLEKVKIAPSEFVRWNYGRVKKQDYYLEELSELNLVGKDADKYTNTRKALEKKEYGFTRDLNEIASSPKLDSDEPVYSRLDGKIAVFYADGNDFGTIQRDEIKRSRADQQANKQQDFDKTIRTNRAQLLVALLEEMLKGNKGMFPHMTTRSRDNDGNEIDALRFETLLWGGDELLFIMPAWIGFEFVQLFFRETKKWPKVGGRSLSHCAGLLLCSARTPIRIARELAQMIADHLKEETRKTRKGKRDGWDYMVLESIDYPTHRDYARFLRERYGSITECHPLIIPPEADWENNRGELILLLLKQLPVRQIYQLGHLLTHSAPEACFAGKENKGSGWPPDAEKVTPLELRENRMLSTCDNRDELISGTKTLCHLFDLEVENQQQRAWLWLHLLELREYIAPQREGSCLNSTTN